MKTLLNNIDLNEALFGNSNIGFVPTMGSLHNGHISLIKKSLKLSNKTIVSIFVNPKQFNNKQDYKKYPRNIKKDLKILKKLKWKSKVSLKKGLENTFNWYYENMKYYTTLRKKDITKRLGVVK